MAFRFSRFREPLQHLLVVLLSVFCVMQLVRPERKTPAGPPPAPLSAAVDVPAEVDAVLRRACYDCHSNSTVYPWYAEVQPVGWWLDGHIRDGRREVNFDVFANYRPMRRFRKLQDIGKEIQTETMPLPSYLIMHAEARLSAEERGLLADWVAKSRESMRREFPPDSLERRRR